MALNMHSGVSVESWVELDADTRMRFECDQEDDCATLYFGSRDEFVLIMYRHHLRNLLKLAGDACAELEGSTS